MSNLINRRGFLAKGSRLLALPLLPSICRGQSFITTATESTPPKRVVFMNMGWGVTKETWFADKEKSGPWKELPEGLAPLKPYMKDVTVVRNCYHQYSIQAHEGSTFWLTGANPYAVAGQNFHNTISADQVAAKVLGQDTRYTSLHLGTLKPEGHGKSVSWTEQGKPIAECNSPLTAYHKLFSAEKLSAEQLRARIREKRSSLDFFKEELRGTSRGLNANDRDKLDEYLQGIRDVEIRIAKEEAWIGKPKPRPRNGLKKPAEVIENGYQEVKVMIDIIIAAMQVDASRVFTYRMPVDSILKSFDSVLSGHGMSHYNTAEKQALSHRRDQALAKLFGYFIQRLKATKELDGSSLFDHTSLTMGTNIHSAHLLSDCPTLISGRGAKLKLGHHIVAKEKTPLCNVWLAQLQGIGLDVESIGDSTGPLSELVI